MRAHGLLMKSVQLKSHRKDVRARKLSKSVTNEITLKRVTIKTIDIILGSSVIPVLCKSFRIGFTV